MPQSLATPAFAGLSPVAEGGTKAALTTGLTTDRKNFIFTPRRGIMEKSKYPGVVQLIERAVWDREAESLSLSTRTKAPLKSLISEGFFLMPLGVEINPRFYRGKKNSFSMRLSEGKQILESNHLDEKEMLKE